MPVFMQLLQGKPVFISTSAEQVLDHEALLGSRFNIG
jgi:hypothetical protein